MSKNILFICGNFGCQLINRTKVIWINPFQLAFTGFKKLQLGPYKGINGEKDLSNNITIIPGRVIKNLYNDFQKAMFDNNYNYVAWGYDWRKDINYNANLLEDYISRIYDINEPVTLIGHSEGGTVILAYLNMIKNYSASLERVDKVILLGPSVKGTYSAAFAFDGQVEQIPIFNILTEGVHYDYIGEVLRSFTALYQLLPKDDYINDINWWSSLTGLGIDVYRFGVRNSLNLDVSGLENRLHILMGTGIATCSGIQWIPDPLRPNVNKLISSVNSLEGDSFMLNSNSEIPNCDNIKFDGVKHLDLFKDKQVLYKIVEIINS